MVDGTSLLAAITPKPCGTEQIEATYRIRGGRDAALSVARLIAHEQTIELPPDVLEPGFLSDKVVARTIEVQVFDGHIDVRLAYPADLAAAGLPSLLALVFGNASYFTGVSLLDVALPPSVLGRLPGPRHGIDGLRRLTVIPERPLCGSALKPLGASASELAAIAEIMVRGGIDIIKDDDGLTDQVFAPFAGRVTRCAERVRETAERTGRQAIYAPNVTGAVDTLLERALFAQERGAGAVEILPGVMGYDAIRLLATSPSFNLPIIAHCAWSGALVRGEAFGLDASLILGLLPRLAGADISALPGFLGRFGVTKAQSSAVRLALKPKEAGIRGAFSMPGGGLTFEGIEETVEVFGADTILLMSTTLFRHPGGM